VTTTSSTPPVSPASASAAAVPAPELAAALRRAGLSEVETGSRRRAEYSSDASNYRVVPAVVAFPRSADEVTAALAVCRELGVPLTGRGAGTSIAGNALSTGLVLDLSRHFNRVLSVDPEQRTAVVEPGAILDSVTAAAAPYGLRFGPDPSTHSRATIGGAIGNNACGSRALRYGRSADNVVTLDVLAGTGARFTAARRGQDAAEPAGPVVPESAKNGPRDAVGQVRQTAQNEDGGRRLGAPDDLFAGYQ